jgi:hypothetical protein
VDPDENGVWGAPRDDTFGDLGDDGPGRGRRGTGFDEFGSSSFDGGGFGSDTFGSRSFDSDSGGDFGGDSFGDLGSDTFDGGDFGGMGGFDQYGFGDIVDTSNCGCYEKKEELIDMDHLAQHLYDLLRREAFVERDRLGMG